MGSPRLELWEDVTSGSNHPFAGEKYIARGITTKEYSDSLALEDAFEIRTLRGVTAIKARCVDTNDTVGREKRD